VGAPPAGGNGPHPCACSVTLLMLECMSRRRVPDAGT